MYLNVATISRLKHCCRVEGGKEVFGGWEGGVVDEEQNKRCRIHLAENVRNFPNPSENTKEMSRGQGKGGRWLEVYCIHLNIFEIFKI